MSQYPWLLLLVYVVTIGVVQLLALWAAISTKPWLLRALAVWTPIALLTTIRVHEPALVLLVSAVLTIGIYWVVQRLGQPRDPQIHAPQQFWRFRVADLLVLVLFLGTWLGITTSAVLLDHQLSLLLPVTLAATPLVLLTLFVHRAVTGPMRLRATLLALSVIWICALLLRIFNMKLYLGEGQPSLGPSWPRETGYHIGALGALATALVLALAMPFGAWAATRTRSIAVRRRATLVAMAVALACGVTFGYLAWELRRYEDWATVRQWCLELGIHSVFFVALSAFIALGTWLARNSWNHDGKWKRRCARVLAMVLAILSIPSAAWLWWQMAWYAPYPLRSDRPGNHYDRIVEIAKKLHVYGRRNIPLPPRSAAELDECVKLLRSANYVPYELRKEPFRNADSPRVLKGHDWMALWTYFRLEMEKAASSGQFDRMADYAIALIRFDAMFYANLHPTSGYWGYRMLMTQGGNLSRTKTQETIELLERTIAEQESAETIAAWHLAQAEHQGGWHAKLKRCLAWPWQKDDFELAADAGLIKEQRHPVEAKNRLLQVDLAIRAFQRERGRLPKSLKELVPTFFSNVPIDPYSGQPLVYLPSENEFLIYSIGPDRVDNGGTVLNRTPRPNEVGYDVALELR